ncbi:MAG: hypothetical protein EOO27_06300 [Comamonadaceae bacterium]|nr:MAG: hypothetical protein EOO27_06300 [Comamonadaceae bacterium]
MNTVYIPPLAGMRARAKAVMQDVSMDPETVTVNCRDLVACTGSFVDELIRQVFTVRHAKSLRVVQVSDKDFIRFLDRQARAHGVSDRVTVVAATTLEGAA